MPGVPDRSWGQVSVSARECIGAARCPFGTDCFAEKARDTAGHADIVVTNHALLAIDAISDAAVLPEHRLLVVDEAHELADRVTSVATAELSNAVLSAATRRVARLVEPELTQRLEAATATFASAIHDATPGRIDRLDDEMTTYLVALRDAASRARSVIDTSPSDPKAASARAEAVTALADIGNTATRIVASFVPEIPNRDDVVWLDHEDNRGSVRAVMRVAPLSVAGLLRGRLFEQSTAVLTSATLTVGGSFDAMAAAWGLTGADETPEWQGVDVGSPFDHAKSGILYVAAHLPPPGRDGTGSAEQLDEIEALIGAAGGRTLGLFSSMRAARAAGEIMRERLSTPVLCQGDDTTSALVKQFADDPSTSLFGTLSLWQGVDVPGPSLSLVLIDRIPFPRPDDPLLSARQRAVAARGGNGFMAVAASHAALLLAQGAGRLLRSVGRPRGGGGAGFADGHRALRRLSACVVAAVLGDHRSGPCPASVGTAPYGQPRTILTLMSGRPFTGALFAVGTALLVASCSTTVTAPPYPCSTIRSRWRACLRWTGRPGCVPTRRRRRATSRTPTAARSTSSAASSVSDIEDFWETAYRRDVRQGIPSGQGAHLVGRRRVRESAILRRRHLRPGERGLLLPRQHDRLGPRRADARRCATTSATSRSPTCWPTNTGTRFSTRPSSTRRTPRRWSPSSRPTALPALTCAGWPRATPRGSPSAPATDSIAFWQRWFRSATRLLSEDEYASGARRTRLGVRADQRRSSSGSPTARRRARRSTPRRSRSAAAICRSSCNGTRPANGRSARSR